MTWNTPVQPHPIPNSRMTAPIEMQILSCLYPQNYISSKLEALCLIGYSTATSSAILSILPPVYIWATLSTLMLATARLSVSLQSSELPNYWMWLVHRPEMMSDGRECDMSVCHPVMWSFVTSGTTACQTEVWRIPCFWSMDCGGQPRSTRSIDIRAKRMARCLHVYTL